MAEIKFNNLFFALWPDQTVRTGLVHLQHGLSGHDGRWHHPDDLHMTLVFLGKVAPERLECVHRVAGKIAAQPFSIELNRLGYWKRPRILWCSPDHTPHPLIRLVHELQLGLSGCGFRPEQRDYRPHVTLARKAGRVDAGLLDVPVIWRPSEFVLAGSHSGTELPRYRILARWCI